MLILSLAVSAGLAYFVFRVMNHHAMARTTRTLSNARDSGVAFDETGNIDAAQSFASMSQKEEAAGERFTGSKARFMELMRVVSEGPKSPEEIRFLLGEGIEPVVRPDGLVYVPCIENEHLSVDGELGLKEEDLDTYIAEGHLQLIPIQADAFVESDRV